MRHAGRGLVEQKQLRLIDQRSADLDAAPVDHRQSADRLEHPLGELRLEYFDERARRAIVDLELALELTAPDQIEPKPLVEPFVIADHDIVEDRQRQRQPRALKGAGNAGVIDRGRRGACNVRTIESDGAAVGAVDSGHDIEERRLARLAGSNQTDAY